MQGDYEIYCTPQCAAQMAGFNFSYFNNKLLNAKKALPWARIKENARERNSRKIIKIADLTAFLSVSNFLRMARQWRARALADLQNAIAARREIFFEKSQCTLFEKYGIADSYLAANIVECFELTPQNFYKLLEKGRIASERRGRRGGRIFVNFDSFADFYRHADFYIKG